MVLNCLPLNAFEKVVSKLLLAVQRHDVSARKAMLAEMLPTITTSAMASIQEYFLSERENFLLF